MATGIIRIIVGSAVAALALAAPALAQSTATSGYDAAALEAMGARYQAMADHYLGKSDRGRFLVQSAAGSYDATALRALGARYQAMAEYYLGGSGNAVVGSQPDGYQPQLHTTQDTSDVVSRYIERNAPVVTREVPDGFQPQLRGPEAVPVSGTDDGFDWRIFGIATGSALLAAALGGTALIATRTRGRVAHP